MTDKFRITGTLYEKNETKLVGKNDYPITEFVIKIAHATNEKFDKYLKFQLAGEGYADKIEKFEKGEVLTVEAVPHGRRWINKENMAVYFNSFDAIFVTSDINIEAPDLTPFPILDKIETEPKKDLPF